MYEHKKAPLAPKPIYYKRVVRHLLLAGAVLGICLVIGTVGYYYTRNIEDTDAPGLLDSFHNASMILSGMGPVIKMTTAAGKWFSSFYALFSGVVFITNIGIVLAPAVHCFFHKLHMEDN